jgi:hypothetical protein
MIFPFVVSVLAFNIASRDGPAIGVIDTIRGNIANDGH